MSKIILDKAGLTVVVNNYLMNSLMTGDSVMVDFPNDNSHTTQGLNGAFAIKKLQEGDYCEVTIRVIRNSTDDSYLNTLSETNNFEEITGSIQQNYTRDGIDGVEKITLTGGAIKKKPSASFNTSNGDEVMEYVLSFSVGKRGL